MILRILVIFISGLISGWILEFIFRSIKNKKIARPSFFSLQMYGFTALFFYLLYVININIVFKIVLIIIFTTLIEFLFGFILLKYKNIRLWDYSKKKFNYKGIICPLFSFFWLLVSLVYYFWILPFLIKINL